MSIVDPHSEYGQAPPPPNSPGDLGGDFPPPTNLPSEEEEGALYEDTPKVSRIKSLRPKKNQEAPRSKKPKDKLTPAPHLSVVGRPPKTAPIGMVPAVPAMTNFDFLEGSYNKIRQSRLILELVAGAIGVIMILVVALGLDAGIQTTASTSALQTLKSIVIADNAKYSADTGLGGITGLTLSADLAGRDAALQSALYSTTDIPAVMQQLSSLAANGITISSINIAPAPPVIPTTTTVPGATTTAATTTTVPAVTSAPMDVTVVAEVKNYDAFTTLTTEIKHLGSYITNVSAVPSGGVPAITVTITASIVGKPAPVPTPFSSLGGKLP
jgi:hypothetical protein